MRVLDRLESLCEAAASEPREHRRVETELEVRLSTLEPLRAGTGHPPCYLVTQARTLDVANGGLGLRSELGLAAGHRVLVELVIDGEHIEQKGRVVWSFDQVAGESLIGVAFDEAICGFEERARAVRGARTG